MKQNPFSLYDFLAHLIPGVIFLVLVNYTLNFEFQEYSFKNQTLDIIIFIVFAYVFGQLISYISSRTVEVFSNFKLKYPSYFLLNIKWNEEGENEWKTCLLRAFIIAFLFPLFSVYEIINLFFGNKFGLAKKLDNVTVNFILKKTDELFEKLKVSYFDGKKFSELVEGNFIVDIKNENKKSDSKGLNLNYYRVIMHYIYENAKHSRPKLDNYVALYGFHRALCLIFNIFSWIFLVKAITYNGLEFNYLISSVFFSFISFAFFSAFMKFYRRFTLEGFMLISVDSDKNLENNIKVEIVNLKD